MHTTPHVAEGDVTTPSPRPRWVTPLTCVAAVCVATVLQLFRSSGVHLWRTLWAEDGALFYTQALESPLPKVIFRSYAGYGHVIPRVLSAIGVLLPAKYWSVYATLSSALVVSLLGLFVYFASEPLLRTPLRRGVLAASMVLLPVLPQEILGAMCNIHWMVPVAILFAVLFPVEGTARVVVWSIVVVFGTLSSPLALLFAPVGLYWLVRAPNRRTRVVPALYLAAVAGQLVIWATAERIGGARPPLFPDVVVNTGKLYGDRVLTELVFGIPVTKDLWPHFGYLLAIAAGLVVAGLLAWKAWVGSRATRWWTIGLTLGSAASFAFSMYSRADMILVSVVPDKGEYFLVGMRYQVLPQLLLLIALLVPFEVPSGLLRPGGPTADELRAPGRGPAAERWVFGALALGWVAVAMVPSFQVRTGRSDGPDWIIGATEADRQCGVDPSASPVVVFSPGGTWEMEVPCRDLGMGVGGEGVEARGSLDPPADR